MIRAILVIVILTALNTYTILRLVSRWPFAQQHIPFVVAVSVLCLLIQLMGPFGDRLVFPGLEQKYGFKILFAGIDWLSYVTLGFMSCLLIYTLGADIITIIWKLIAVPSSSVNFDRRAFITLGAVTVGTTALGIGQAAVGPEVREVSIPLKGLPASFDGFRIAQISDLHVGPTIGRDYAQNVVTIVNGLKPDLIALTGDFVDGTIDGLKDDIAPIAALQAPYGTFYITGNHEYYWGADAWCAHFKTLGARVFNNDHELIRRGDDAFVMAGVTDYSTLKMGTPDACSPARALNGAPAGLVKILLAHQPITYQMAEAAGVNLQLSGHTHAGQYFPFTLLIYWFQHFVKGLNRHKDMWVYVNRGTGHWGPPLRTAMRSEITLITLRQA